MNKNSKKIEMLMVKIRLNINRFFKKNVQNNRFIFFKSSMIKYEMLLANLLLTVFI